MIDDDWLVDPQSKLEQVCTLPVLGRSFWIWRFKFSWHKQAKATSKPGEGSDSTVQVNRRVRDTSESKQTRRSNQSTSQRPPQKDNTKQRFRIPYFTRRRRIHRTLQLLGFGNSSGSQGSAGKEVLLAVKWSRPLWPPTDKTPIRLIRFQPTKRLPIPKETIPFVSTQFRSEPSIHQ